MINSVEIVKSDNKWDFKREIDKHISRGNVKDIKFCVNPKIHSSYTSSYSSGEYYFAMIIYAS